MTKDPSLLKEVLYKINLLMLKIADSHQFYEVYWSFLHEGTDGAQDIAPNQSYIAIGISMRRISPPEVRAFSSI